MKKIIIWGTSLKAKRLLNCLDYSKIKIIGFTDNDYSKLYMDDFVRGYPYVPWEDLIKKEYDYIVIASSAFVDITVQLIFNNILPEKIIQAYNCQFMFPNALFFFNELETDKNKYDLFVRFETFCFEAGIGDL